MNTLLQSLALCLAFVGSLIIAVALGRVTLEVVFAVMSQGLPTPPYTQDVRKLLSAAADAPRILIFDDDATTLLLYKRELANDGYKVVTASNINEALDRFFSESPDLVVIDMRMPGMHSPQTTARHVPVLLTNVDGCARANHLPRAIGACIGEPSDLRKPRSTVRDLFSPHMA